MSGPANLIANKLECPRDAMVFRSLSQEIHEQVEVPKKLYILGTDGAEIFLSRRPGHVEDLTVVCPYPRDCGFHKILPFIGGSLTRLDIRCQGEISLSILEFLPRLEHLTVAAKRITNFPCLPKAPWGEHFMLKTLRLVVTDHIVLPSQLGSMYPLLERVEIACYSLGCGVECRFPPGLRHLSINANSFGSNLWVFAMQDLRNLETFCAEGARVGCIPHALQHSDVLKTVRMRDWALVHTANLDLHILRHVEVLDLGGNDGLTLADIEGIEFMPNLDSLDLRGCTLFDDTESDTEDEIGGGSSSLTTLHLSIMPPRTWLWKFQNLKDVYIHPPGPCRGAEVLLRKANGTDAEKGHQEEFRTIHIPDSRGGPSFKLHLHVGIRLGIDDVLILTDYIDCSIY